MKEEEEETEEHGRKSRLAGTASTRREKSAETPLAAVNLSLANRGPSRRSGGTAKSTSSSFYYQVRKLRPGHLQLLDALRIPGTHKNLKSSEPIKVEAILGYNRRDSLGHNFSVLSDIMAFLCLF